MNQEVEPKNELMCPITMNFLEYPVALPCCGRCISRESLVLCFNENQNCPLCKANLDHINPLTMPKLINIAYMVEEAKRGSVMIWYIKQ